MAWPLQVLAGMGANFRFQATVAANTNNYNLRSAAVAAGWNQLLPLAAEITINSGIIVGSSSTGTAAFDTGVSFPVGSSLKLTNNGKILGMGGNGGVGVSPGSAGGAGGGAFRAQYAITVLNNGQVGGGGGGGGGGAGTWVETTKSGTFYYAGGGGGGGQGSNGGAGGGGGTGTSGTNNGGAGGAGSPTTTGGPGAPSYATEGWYGGYGGALGAVGGTSIGKNGSSNNWGGNSAGGAGGYCAVGTSFINAGAGIPGSIFGGQS